MAAPEISGVTAQQRPGTKLVDITYNVTSETSTVDVSLEVSADGGATFAVPVITVTGHVGNDVAIGATRTITWNAGIDWDNQSSNQIRIRLKADDGVAITPGGFSQIPSGSFTMGRISADNESPDQNAPPVTVEVSEFYMGQKEVSKALWDEVKSWADANGYSGLVVGGGKAPTHPVHLVRWLDVVKWCNAKSEMDGLNPVYRVSGSVMRSGTIAPTADWSANGYRLPTEAEWEKAARGGFSGRRFPWGNSINHTNANYVGGNPPGYDTNGYTQYTRHPTFNLGSQPYTAPIGSFAANNFGLFDVTGNVREWCWDSFGNYVNGANDPRGPEIGEYRSTRGGGWDAAAGGCKLSLRDFSAEYSSSEYTGFRLARTSVENGVGSATTLDMSLITISWTLATSPVANGTIQGAGTYLAGANADLIAFADPGYVFAGWSGDAPGTDNPLTLNMDSDKTVGATFGPDLSDVDNDGLSAYDEVVLHGTDPSLADTDGDGFGDSFELSSGFSATSSASTPESRSSIVQGSGDAEGSVEFRFNGAAGVSYRIEATTTLDDWGTLDALVIGTGGSMSKSYTMAGNPVRFFRLIRN